MAGGGTASSTKVVQVTNIAPQATKDQMQSLFGNIGKIDEIRLYPTVRDVSCPVQSRICYVKYLESNCVPVAQHLTNTVFIDRALIVIPVQMIPDEYRALEMSKNGTIVPGLHKPDSKLPPEVVNRLEGCTPQQVSDVEIVYDSDDESSLSQVVRTYDPKLDENGLPGYPLLPAHMDTRKIEEIRRTILVCDVKSEWRMDDLMDLFERVGEVKYARWAEKDGKTYAMIEFCEQKCIIDALRMQGSEYKNSYLNLYHATDAIIKPEAKSNEAAQREIEEAMSIVKEAQSMISAAIDPVIGMLAKDKRRRSRSRSRSRERRRSRRRSRSRSRRSSSSRSKRSRSRSKRRSRSRRSRSRRSSSRPKRSKIRSRSKRSRSKRHSRSRSKSKRSRSRDRRRRSNSRGSRNRRSRSRAKRSRSRDRKRSHRKEEEKSRRSRSRSKRRSSSRGRTSRSKDNKSSSSKKRSRSNERRSKKVQEEPILRDYDAEEKIGQRPSEEKKISKSPSLEKSDNMDISNSP